MSSLQDKLDIIYAHIPEVLPPLAAANEEYEALTGEYLEFHLEFHRHPDGSNNAPGYIFFNHNGQRHQITIDQEAKENMAEGIMPPAVPVEPLDPEE